MSITAHHARLGGNGSGFFQAVCQHSVNVENPQFSIHVETDVYRDRHFLYTSAIVPHRAKLDNT